MPSTTTTGPPYVGADVWTIKPVLNEIRRTAAGVGNRSADMLAIGGFDTGVNQSKATCELWSHAAWSMSASMNVAKAGMGAGGTPSDCYSCAGWHHVTGVMSTVEKFNGVSWAVDTAMPKARYLPIDVGQASNNLLMVGGQGYGHGPTTTTAPPGPGTTPPPAYGNLDDCYQFNGVAWTKGVYLPRKALNGGGTGTPTAAILAGYLSDNPQFKHVITGTWNVSWADTSQVLMKKWGAQLSGQAAGGGNSLILSGGHHGGLAAWNVISEEFNGVAWSRAPDMNQARMEHGGDSSGSSAAGGGTGSNIMVFGGSDQPGGSSLAHTESFTRAPGVTTTTAPIGYFPYWCVRGSLIEAKQNPGGAGPMSRALAIAGDDYPSPNNETTSVQVFNPASGGWQAHSNINQARSRTSACGTSSDLFLLVAGWQKVGIGYMLTCEKYNGAAWSLSASYPHKVSGHVVLGTDVLAIAVGGKDLKFPHCSGVTTTTSPPAPPTSTTVGPVGYNDSCICKLWNNVAWSAIAPLSIRRGDHCGFGDAASALVLGDGNANNVCEIYNGVAWSTGPNLNMMVNAAAGAAGDLTDGITYGGARFDFTCPNPGSPWGGNTIGCERYNGAAWACASALNTGRGTRPTSCGSVGGSGVSAVAASGGDPTWSTSESFGLPLGSCPTTTTTTTAAPTTTTTTPMPPGWTVRSNSNVPRTWGVTIAGKANKAWVLGGSTPGPVVDFEKWDGPGWQIKANYPIPIQQGVSVSGLISHLNEVVAAGGTTSGSVRVAGVWKWSHDSWAAMNSMLYVLELHRVAGDTNDMLVFGGQGLCPKQCHGAQPWPPLPGPTVTTTAPPPGPTTTTTAPPLITGICCDAQRFNGIAWAVSPKMGWDKFYHAGAGLATAALACGGIGKQIATTLMEEWNNIAWSVGTALLGNEAFGAAAGRVTDMLLTGVNYVNVSTNRYNGAAWSVVSSLNLSHGGDNSDIDGDAPSTGSPIYLGTNAFPGGLPAETWHDNPPVVYTSTTTAGPIITTTTTIAPPFPTTTTVVTTTTPVPTTTTTAPPATWTGIRLAKQSLMAQTGIYLSKRFKKPDDEG
jgi:hypothetical protein